MYDRKGHTYCVTRRRSEEVDHCTDIHMEIREVGVYPGLFQRMQVICQSILRHSEGTSCARKGMRPNWRTSVAFIFRMEVSPGMIAKLDLYKTTSPHPTRGSTCRNDCKLYQHLHHL